ncbi:MAG TPA: type II toxin-antitoxin system RelE/ParE family toxin [Terriglobia bacterium]|nr:type II toxin-antitoxin system RelE/ParE family toxin [Terriglobia bacterium]
MPSAEEGGSSRPYRLFESAQFLRDLARLGPAAQARLEAKLREYVYPVLRENPHFGPNIKRLKNWQPPTWRYRVGEWRFFYQLDDRQKIVFMAVADHRKSAYR